MNYYPLSTDLSTRLQDPGKADPRAGMHPGLVLDRFAAYPDESFDTFNQERGQCLHIDVVIAASDAAKAVYGDHLLKQWPRFVGHLPGPPEQWLQSTVWRLAAHLSRASSLENGSVCLHPLYGFAYLPGSGLKGLALAQAKLSSTVPSDQESIQRIFGAPGHGAGSVIFLDAWPEAWPKLQRDIVNNHHRHYYERRGKDSPPGDWESPNPTYFLAVAPGTAFRFAVLSVPARSAGSNDVHLAKRWLQQGLQELGAGAKTAAGYGYFGEPSEPAGGGL